MNEDIIGPENCQLGQYRAPQASVGDIEMNTALTPHDPHNQTYDWGSSDEQDESDRLLSDVRHQLENNNTNKHKKMSVTQLQPAFHQRNKGLMEMLCRCCSEGCDMTKREIQYYYKFQEQMIKPYDDLSSEHEILLTNYYIKIFDHTQIPERLLSTEWQTIGFQSKNPRTDFRGGGILGLHCLRYFAAAYKEEMEVIRSDKTDTFFFAITSINITHLLITYFYLNKSEVSEESKRLRAGRKQMKRFVRLNAENKRAFFEIHSFAMIYIYKTWQVEYSISKPSIPNFNQIIDLFRKQLHEFLKQPVLVDLQTMKKQFVALVDSKFKSS